MKAERWERACPEEHVNEERRSEVRQEFTCRSPYSFPANSLMREERRAARPWKPSMKRRQSEKCECQVEDGELRNVAPSSELQKQRLRWPWCVVYVCCVLCIVWLSVDKRYSMPRNTAERNHDRGSSRALHGVLNHQEPRGHRKRQEGPVNNVTALRGRFCQTSTQGTANRLFSIINASTAPVTPSAI